MAKAKRRSLHVSKYRCPFSEKCTRYLKIEELREHGIDAHRLRIAAKKPGERFADYIVEMKTWDERQKRSRKWKLLYEVDTDIYLLRVRRMERAQPSNSLEENL